LKKPSLASGYFVLTAFDAIQAVSKARKGKPDLIILDIHIPAGGGLSLAEKFKRSTHTCSIPIIFLTASSDEEDEKRAMRLGALFYFRKPISDAEFLEAVRSALESKL
jgi:putative two-component system response regulator